MSSATPELDFVERKSVPEPSNETYNQGQGLREPRRPIPLPKPGERNILITSALPYVNNVPHLGNIIGCVLSADVYARFCRQRGYNSLYICGTDEYGTATETKAQQEGVTPRELCDKYNAIHRKVYDWFDISFDYFGRTSTPAQTEIAQDIFDKCNKNGYVKPNALDQLYCVDKCKRFLADRFVAGTCPHPGCGYPDAKGDQCDKCGQLVNAVELKDPRCTTCGAAPEVRTTQHLFLDLPSLKPKLEEYVKAHKSTWSTNAYTQTNAWLAKELKPRCITRDLKWGTPVPLEGYTDKVFYVWFDAPIGYISITANYTPEWRKWWCNPEQVQLVQFMGKDNVPFHTIIFPSTLLAANDNYTLMSSLPTTEYLNYDGSKFSKTRGIGVFGDNAMDTGIPADVWRYYLLYNRPEDADTMFTWEDLAAKVNADLNNNFGNLVQRVLGFISSKLGGKIPARTSPVDAEESKLETEIAQLLNNYINALDKCSLKSALYIALNISIVGNKFMQDRKPWEQLVNDPEAGARTLFTLAQVVALLGVVLEPYMPNFGRTVAAQLNRPRPLTALKGYGSGEGERQWSLADAIATKDDDTATGLYVAPGHTIVDKPTPIFSKLEVKTVDELRQRFAGRQAESKEGQGPDFPLDLVVANVKDVQVHPKNEKNYVLTLDVGEEKPRQVVSGLAGSYSQDELKGQNVVLIKNLKPSRFGGVESHGMVLTAIVVEDNVQKPYILTCANKPPGTEITPRGCGRKPVNQFDVKAKLAGLQLAMAGPEKALCGGYQLFAGDAPISCAKAVDGSRIA